MPGSSRDREGDRGGRGGGAPRPRKGDRDGDRQRTPAPALDDEFVHTDLDKDVRAELRSLPKDVAERVGRHLVATRELVDSDPVTALEHAKYAKSIASRIAVVREAVGLAAYHAGEWSRALSELRAVRRMSRTDMHLPVIADAERANGRPERALEILRETDLGSLPAEVAVELRIVAAGARLDLGQPDAAVIALQGADLDPQRRDPWSGRLFYAYADNLLAAGRSDEALQWFLHAAEADTESDTDAAERASDLAAELAGTEGQGTVEDRA
ncbi:hypothetical protein SAMN06265360_1483 [Haloechinothrix alba]|uniref:Tetratricopeptide repeat-containing protein n=1 Tax=Haloechinothrix alba TaxID=664784 RepID=A0A239AM77_9PSEU|nr:hypothetical protein [Haloechinothrix alba]SNR96669.1 hypothetical protein SAMN06265360_1483 [Haloechinothrix alba]